MSFKIKPPLGRRLNPYHPLARGLVGCWVMNEGSGDRIYDLSGNGNHGDLTAFNLVWSPNGLKFESTNDYVHIPVGAEYSNNLTAHIILEISAAADHYHIMGQFDANSDAWELLVDVNRELWWADDDNWAVNKTGDVLNLSSVYSIGYQYSSVYGTKIYFNGLETDSSSNVSSRSHTGLRIGKREDGGVVGCPMTVYMVSLYNRVLTPQEIVQLHIDPYAMLEPVFDPVLFGYGLVGTICWGHDTGVVEVHIRDYSGNWTGTGAITGIGDAEQIELQTGEYMESEDWELGSCLFNSARLRQNVYQAGDDVTLKYKTAVTQGALAGVGWSAYTGPFQSLGWAKVRVER